MLRIAGFIIGLVVSLAVPVAGQAQSFDPGAARRSAGSARTQVMVLGTAHLDAAARDWDPAVLAPLVDRLARFRPDVITIEDQPGPTIAKTWAYRAILPEAAATFAGRALLMSAAAGLSLDMDMPQAEAALRAQLAGLPQSPAAADRRRLAALFAAAGDPHSALVQWWQLPEAERVPGDGVSQRLAALLDELGASRNESVLLAARLAVRLGLQRLHPIDAQDEDVLTPPEAELFYRSVFPEVAERINADPRLADRGSVTGMTDPERTVAEYRKLNDAAVWRRMAAAEWLDMADRATAADVGRKRTAAWEARNLRMAANIREASARAPGGRVLVIVGAAHKPWLEAYLGMMADLELVATESVLR